MDSEEPPPAPAPAAAPAGVFAATQWTMVLQAGRPGEPGATLALERLFQAYWYPVYAYVRSRGHQPEDAKDLTQGFFASLLRRESLETVTPDKGRFRTFLIRSLQYHLSDVHSKAQAARRGGGSTVVELDALNPEQRYALEPESPGDSPDAAFDRRWSAVVMGRALSRLEQEQVSAGRGPAFAVLREFLGGAPHPGAYRVAEEQLGVERGTIAVRVQRLRQRCRELLIEEVRQTVGSRTELEDELRALFRR
jgi:RNA polymerase sigma factor (sigma-70 family)